MSQKILWSSVKIQVPSEFITVSKTGQIRIKPPLTKKKKISTANKQPSIQLIPADVDEVKIIDQGTKETQNNTTNKKQYKPRKQKSIIQEEEEVIDQPKITLDQLQHPKLKFGNRFVKGSQAAKDFMQEMRNKRGKNKN